jgi:hypothetical protein
MGPALHARGRGFGARASRASPLQIGIFCFDRGGCRRPPVSENCYPRTVTALKRLRALYLSTPTEPVSRNLRPLDNAELSEADRSGLPFRFLGRLAYRSHTQGREVHPVEGLIRLAADSRGEEVKDGRVLEGDPRRGPAREFRIQASVGAVTSRAGKSARGVEPAVPGGVVETRGVHAEAPVEIEIEKVVWVRVIPDPCLESDVVGLVLVGLSLVEVPDVKPLDLDCDADRSEVPLYDLGFLWAGRNGAGAKKPKSQRRWPCCKDRLGSSCAWRVRTRDGAVCGSRASSGRVLATPAWGARERRSL